MCVDIRQIIISRPFPPHHVPYLVSTIGSTTDAPGSTQAEEPTNRPLPAIDVAANTPPIKKKRKQRRKKVDPSLDQAGPGAATYCSNHSSSTHSLFSLCDVTKPQYTLVMNSGVPYFLADNQGLELSPGG